MTTAAEVLRKLHEAATPPPWNMTSEDAWCECGGEHEDSASCEDWNVACPASVEEAFTEDCGDYFGLSNENARLIAALRNALPELLAVLEAAETHDHINLLDDDEPCQLCVALAALNAKVGQV